MAPETPDPQLSDDDPETYVGMSPQDAERRAREQGWTTVRQLAPDALVTMEYLSGRINLAVQDEQVVRCWKG
ncbi:MULTISPECIES: hypothetical protein [unclassified Streptomyces]|uniref:hypothetical protein n=1 Tax=unclassified Streptomyces TaxID=2593676 RepID=UPI002DD88029|nr:MULTISPECIES: hypothetical protein [unclassified Streptomyces]WSA95752.1 hypothetical protein OIE63_32490 [Streptomyces sp. NBC_01795]WSB80172.1 hypothetical protein OHB04_33605 [Streptomyces sp. NBC_01775]WSS11620.1 hypothetical protein OG533_06605 [Streptomyces sp. NBC_01186]WSS40335.1 hypothetical protein OG220_06750 [Streptomyces sp. NBC_01187]